MIRHAILSATLLAVVTSSSSSYALDPVALTDGPGRSTLLSTANQCLAARGRIDQVAFDRDGDWVLTSGTCVAYSNRSKFEASGLVADIKRELLRGAQVRAVAFATNGHWLLVTSTGRYSSYAASFTASGLNTAIDSLGADNVRQIAIDEASRWVMLGSDGRARYNALVQAYRPPAEMVATLADTIVAQRSVRSVALRDGHWMVLADNWSQASSYDAPLAGFITLTRALDYQMDRVAFGPSGRAILVSHGATTPPPLVIGDLAAAQRSKAYAVETSLKATGDAHLYNIWERMVAHDVKSVAIAVFDRRGLLWTRGYGEYSPTSSTLKPVLTSTRFSAASMSKAVAGALVLRLARSYPIDLSDTIEDLWAAAPSRPTPFTNWLTSELGPLPLDWMDERLLDVTVQDLLSHTGGFNAHGIGSYPRSSVLPSISNLLFGTNPANNSRIHRSEPLPFHKFYDYSGGGYTVLESAIEAVTGDSFADLAQDEILTPLGMTRSTFKWPSDEQSIASPYGDQGYRECPGKAAGGLLTTASDYARFAGIFLNSGRSTSTGVKLLEGEEYRAAINPNYIRLTQQSCVSVADCPSTSNVCEHMPLNPNGGKVCATLPPNYDDAELDPKRYGLGVKLEAPPSNSWFPKAVYHGGSHEGYRSKFWTSISENWGYVILTNSYGDDAGELIDELTAALEAVY